MKIPLRRLFPIAALACEALSLAALFLSEEVPRSLFFIPLVLGAAAFSVKLRDRWLLPLIASVVLAGLYAGIRSGLPTAVVVAFPMVAVHALTWLAPEQGRYRYWRIGLAFLEMILAAILAPEAHMFLLIFLFVIVVSLALSFGFLEQNFASRDPAGLNRPLRATYLGAVLFLSFVIFLSSLAIFPLLPRKENVDMNSLGAMPGYSEEVSFQTATFYWTGDESRPVMWLFLPPGNTWAEVVPFGLLRGKTLERFNGRTWRQGNRRGNQLHSAAAPAIDLEILREPMPTEVLPSPYGTEGMELAGEARPFRYDTGEWYQPAGRGRRLKYTARVVPGAARDRVVDKRSAEMPGEGYERLAALGRSLQKNTRSDRERVTAVVKYFQDGNFRAEQVPLAAVAEKGSSPVENFLFERKVGHCELFATAAALLLRSMGMPTRLVVGFRAPVSSAASVLTIRNGDAHAWVEVWTSEGWTVIDPTPAIPLVQARWQAVRDFYDWVTAYWHRYILGYEFDAMATLKWVGGAGTALTGIFLLAGIFRFLRRIANRPKKGPREDVAWVRISLQKRLAPAEHKFRARLTALPGGTEWWEKYERLRFGEALPSEDAIRNLRRESKTILRAARAEPPGPPIH